MVNCLKKIIINIQNDALLFSYKRNHTIREDLMNTNIISDSELVFSDDYIVENKKIVMPFFQELCEMYQIKTIVFQNCELASFLLEFFNHTSVNKVSIKKQETIPYSFYEQLIQIKNIQFLDCYAIANFILELLDNHHIKVTTHSEVF